MPWWFGKVVFLRLWLDATLIVSSRLAGKGLSEVFWRCERRLGGVEGLWEDRVYMEGSTYGCDSCFEAGVFWVSGLCNAVAM